MPPSCCSGVENGIKDVAVAEGKITAIEDEISLPPVFDT